MADELTTYASVTPRGNPRIPASAVDQRVVVLARAFEKQFETRVFCIIHPSEGQEQLDCFSERLHEEVLDQLQTVERRKAIAILLDSPGGDLRSAFRIAKTIKRHCSEYYVFIPRLAASAATVLALGASRLYFGEHAEIGPIDPQVSVPDHARRVSSLEVVHSLTRINSEALQIMESTLTLLSQRSGKRPESLISEAIKYTSDFVRPIVEKIDSVSFTFHSRLLKTAEAYAYTLLVGGGMDEDSAKNISAKLTRGYHDHAFVIDCGEAQRIGLDVLSSNRSPHPI